MSYNLFVEGVDDYVAMSLLAARFPAFELFPIPPEEGEEHGALGVALPSSRAEEGAAVVADLVREILDAGYRVHDLYPGHEVETDDDLAELALNLAG